MSTEILAAIIASVASILVALATLIISMVSNKHSARSMREIEELKFSLARSTSNKGISDSHLDESLRGLQIAIQSIQLVKDELQLLSVTLKRDEDCRNTIERITTAREKMFLCYEEQLPVLESVDAALLHDAKNISLSIENLARQCLSHKRRVAWLSTKAGQELIALRARLTEIQQSLRDNRAELIMRKIGISEDTGRIQNRELKDLSKFSNHGWLTKDGDLLKGFRILVVDDDYDSCSSLSTLLQMEGADTQCCYDGRHALEVIPEWKPDILISDIGLPDIDGLELIRKIRVWETDQPKKIRAVAVSGYGEEMAVRARSAGFQLYVARPFEPSEFARSVAKLAKEN